MTDRIITHHVSPYHAVQGTEAEIGKIPGVPEALPTMADPWDHLIADSIREAQKAMRKFPQPNYVISKVAEEAGEVVKAAIHAAEGRETAENLRGEMKQLIAMLYRLWIEGDQVHGLPPISTLADAQPAYWNRCDDCHALIGAAHQRHCPEDGIVTEAQTYGGRRG